MAQTVTEGSAPEESTAAKKQEAQYAYTMHAIWFRSGKGFQRYREYLAQASPIAQRYGARRVDALMPVEVLRGAFDPDYVSVIQWPSIDHYNRFIKDVQYRAVATLREEAVAKSCVIHCRRVG